MCVSHTYVHNIKDISVGWYVCVCPVCKRRGKGSVSSYPSERGFAVELSLCLSLCPFLDIRLEVHTVEPL